MFGKNKVSSSYNQDGSKLNVNELFYTIQGEGPDAGKPAIFLRLAKCNLRCHFCDTEFESGEEQTLQELASDIAMMSKRSRCNLVVITGGEPLLQNICPLVYLLNKVGITVSVETAGTVYFDQLSIYFDAARSNGNLIVCSPKTPKVHPGIERIAGAWKYVVSKGRTGTNGLPYFSTQRVDVVAPVFTPSHPVAPIYVQAMDEQDPTKNDENLTHAADIAMRHGYILSIQMHKLAGLR